MLVRYLNQHVVFSTPSLNPHDVYQSFAVVCKALLHPNAPQSWKQVALCAFRFCVPTDDGVPWVFRGEETMDKFYQLLAPMADSAACKVKTSGKCTQTEEATAKSISNSYACLWVWKLAVRVEARFECEL